MTIKEKLEELEIRIMKLETIAKELEWSSEIIKFETQLSKF